MSTNMNRPDGGKAAIRVAIDADKKTGGQEVFSGSPLLKTETDKLPDQQIKPKVEVVESETNEIKKAPGQKAQQMKAIVLEDLNKAYENQ